MSKIVYSVYEDILGAGSKLCIVDGYKSVRYKYGWVWYCEGSNIDIDKFFCQYGMFNG